MTERWEHVFVRLVTDAANQLHENPDGYGDWLLGALVGAGDDRTLRHLVADAAMAALADAEEEEQR